MSFEETVRAMITDELDKRERKSELQPVAQFCKDKHISRVSLWRHEKQGRVKIVRIGSKLFINPDQFL